MEHPSLYGTGTDLVNSIQFDEKRGSPASILIGKHSELQTLKKDDINEFRLVISSSFSDIQPLEIVK